MILPLIKSRQSAAPLLGTLLSIAIILLLITNAAHADLVISEIQATPASSSPNATLDVWDWMEIYNPTDASVNLREWHLTDNPKKLEKWTFPATNIPPRGFLVVYASGQNQTTPGLPLHTNFKLEASGEFLALSKPDGTIAHQFAPKFPAQVSGISFGLAMDGDSVKPNEVRYFSTPTPGARNVGGTISLGGVITKVGYSPKVPTDSDPVLVTARVEGPGSGESDVYLHYRVMFQDEVQISMNDSGVDGDRKSGDGTFSATIPDSVAGPGQMLRWYVTAGEAREGGSRMPPFPDPENSPQYFGTVISNPEITTQLPVLHWFVQSPHAANREDGTRCSIFLEGELYDNVFVNIRGQTSRRFPKVSYNFNLNKGHKLKYQKGSPSVGKFNLLSTYTDKSYMRQILAYETFRDAGAPYHSVFPMRIQQNAEFFSLALFCDDADGEFLERNGLDPKGALYKMYNGMTAAEGDDLKGERNKKRTRKHEPYDDLAEMINGLSAAPEEQTSYLFDHVNLPEVVNFLAATILTGNLDFGAKNYYLYRDTEGTGEWQMLPWDLDLTFGRKFNRLDFFYDDELYADTPLFVGGDTLLAKVIYDTPSTRQMYLRRLRTLMDELLQPPGTPAAQLRYEKRIHELTAQMEPDAKLDLARWSSWGRLQNLQQAVAGLTNYYLVSRRKFLYEHPKIPGSQPAEVSIEISRIEITAEKSEQFVELTNSNSFAVDLSGWKLAGSVEHTFPPGVVMIPNSVLYVSPDVRAFKAREVSPKGGEGLLVQGNYKGDLSPGGTVTVKCGRRVVATRPVK